MQQRMDFEQLLLLQDVLDTKLCIGEMSYDDYEHEWRELLSAAGYSPHDYESLIDDRWDRLDKLIVKSNDQHRFS